MLIQIEVLNPQLLFAANREARRLGFAGAYPLNHLVRHYLESLMDGAPAQDDSRRIVCASEWAVFEALKERAKTVRELQKETGKHAQNLSLTVRSMVDRAWLESVSADTFTGGRPANRYQVTLLGSEMVDREESRRSRLKARGEADQKRAMRESALAHPDHSEPKPKPKQRLKVVDQSTPEGKWKQAGIAALYDIKPEISDDDLKATLDSACFDIVSHVDWQCHKYKVPEADTWAIEMASLESGGWDLSRFPLQKPEPEADPEPEAAQS